jgi:hypothetical protein
VSLYELLLFLHVLSAFAFIAAYTVDSVILVIGRTVQTTDAALVLLRLARPADVLAWIGATGTLAFGTWLAIDLEVYALWDPWVAAAFGLWLVAEEAIRREDLFFRLARRRMLEPVHPRSPSPRYEPQTVFRSRRALVLHLAGSVAMLGLLALMIYKPGAA